MGGCAKPSNAVGLICPRASKPDDGEEGKSQDDADYDGEDDDDEENDESDNEVEDEDDESRKKTRMGCQSGEGPTKGIKTMTWRR